MSNFEKWLCKIENVSFYAKIDKKKIKWPNMNALITSFFIIILYDKL